MNENYIGKTVRVIKDNANSAHHPTEDRYVKIGDLIVIKAINKGGLLVFDVDPKFTVNSTSENGRNTQKIEIRFVELVPNPWAGLVEIESLIK